MRCPLGVLSKPEVVPFTRYSDCSEIGPLRPSRNLLPTNLPLFSRGLQLPIPLGMDLRLTPGEHVLRRDVALGAVQADVVVVMHVAPHQAPCIIERQRRPRPDAPAFQRLVPAFDLTVWIEGRTAKS